MKKILTIVVLISCFIQAAPAVQKITDPEVLSRKGRAQKITGVIFLATGSVSLVSGIAIGVVHTINPTLLPFSINLGTSYSAGYYQTIYFNPVSLALNLFGIAFIAAGIPLLAVGSYRVKKAKKLSGAALLFTRWQPEISFHNTNKLLTFGTTFRF